MWILTHLMLSQRAFKLFSVFKICCSDWVIFIIPPDHLWVLLYQLATYSFLWLFFFYFSSWIFHFWLSIFYVSSSLLKFSLCSSILFLNSVNILITSALNYLSGKLFICFITFLEFSPVLLIETSSSAFSSCFTFSTSMNLD